MSEAKVEAPKRAAPKRRSKKRKNQIFRLVRRVHMYSGLMLLPFVLMYGATGWLFNHPTHFADLDSTGIGESEVAETGFANVASPEVLAAEVVKRLRAQRAGGAEDFVLLESVTPHYDKRLVGNARANGTEYALRVNLATKQAEFFSRSPRAVELLPEPAPFAITLDVDESDALLELFGREIEFKLHQLFVRNGIESGNVRMRGGMPELRFAMRHAGRDWLVRYDARRGVVAGNLLGEAQDEVSARDFLTKLHLQHGYSDGVDARSVWAFVVDVMSVLLVFWGVSGIVMWLQMRNLRRSGAWFLGVGLLVAAVLGAVLLRFFTHG